MKHSWNSHTQVRGAVIFMNLHLYREEHVWVSNSNSTVKALLQSHHASLPLAVVKSLAVASQQDSNPGSCPKYSSYSTSWPCPSRLFCKKTSLLRDPSGQYIPETHRHNQPHWSLMQAFRNTWTGISNNQNFERKKKKGGGELERWLRG